MYRACQSICSTSWHSWQAGVSHQPLWAFPAPGTEHGIAPDPFPGADWWGTPWKNLIIFIPDLLHSGFPSFSPIGHSQWHKLIFLHHLTHWRLFNIIFQSIWLVLLHWSSMGFSPLASKSIAEPLKGFTSVKYYPQNWEIKSKWAFFLFPLRHVKRIL